MNADIMTIMWKESKGLFKQGKSRSKSILVLLTPVLMFGIILPIQFREEWLDMGWSLAIALFTPLILIAPTICESFAGERERHTLETLLASRLPDRAILFGKMIVSIVYGWGMTVFLLLMSLVIVNVLMWAGKFQFYQMKIFLADIGLSLLFSGLMVTLGILISLRSATVQSAQQVLMMALVIPIFGLQAVVFLLPTFIPMENIREFLGRFDYDQILLIFLGVLLLADIGLLLAAMSRFKRSRLILKLSLKGAHMNTSQIFIVISIVTLAIVAILFLAARKNKKKLTPLAGLAWAFVLAGIIFGEDRLIGYGLMGVGVVLALIDMFIQLKRKTT